MAMMNRLPLTCVDMLSRCQGPQYTYCSSSGHESYIDHCIVSKPLLQTLEQCSVLPDEVTNSSDHLAIHTTWALPSHNTEEPQVTDPRQPRIAWHKLSNAQITEQYCWPLDYLVNQYTELVNLPSDCSMWTHDQISTVTEDVTELALRVSRTLDKPSRACRRSKPYWNRGLSHLSSEKRKAWKEWVARGRPRDLHDQTWVHYQECKRQFRREQRRAQAHHEEQFLCRLEHKAASDPRTFWSLLNRRVTPRSNHPSVQPFVRNDGTVLTHEPLIRDAWRDYFQELYTTKTPAHYNSSFQQEVKQRLSSIPTEPRKDDTTLLKDDITYEDVHMTCRKLKIGTAPGADGLQPGNLKYAGPAYLQLVTHLFNAIVSSEWRPPTFKRGLIVPIPKGHKKDPSIPDNNRELTLMPVLGKVLDTLLVKRAESWIDSTLDDLQGANRRCTSSLEVSAVLQEVISHNMNRGHTVYVALLDIKKAFDTVWHAGMFLKLHDLGMDPKLWRILLNSYSEFRCAVRIGHRVSDWFTPGQGVHQGDVFSMRLHSLYINSLLTELRSVAKHRACGHIQEGTESATVNQLQLQPRLEV